MRRRSLQVIASNLELIPYCKFGNFRENFIFANSVERHICDVKNSRLKHALNIHVSVNHRVISPFREGLLSRSFAYAKYRENKTLVKISDITVYSAYVGGTLHH